MNGTFPISCSSFMTSRHHLFNSAPQKQFTRVTPTDSFRSHKTFVSCKMSPIDDMNITRRSANYQPTIWKDDYIQSIRSDYAEETAVHQERIAMLKGSVKQILEKLEVQLDKLEMIDDLERLGISYQFDDEIAKIVTKMYNDSNDMCNEEDLHATSLRFRILRQHGYKIHQDVFQKFKDETGKFKASLSKDTKGLLYLYEASYLSINGETLLEEARDFSTKHLKESLENKTIPPDLAMLVAHALELPLRWRVQRLEARWYIDVYERRLYMNYEVLELAKLDFNLVQAIYQEDLKFTSRWWTSTGMGEKLSFARDRLMENFLWTVGVTFEPQLQYGRRMATKVNALITTIDDIYDVYGTLDELELFTDAVERWDISAMEQLPDYMKICYLSLFNFVNEMAYDTLTREGLFIISYLRKAWVNLCKAYLVEAKWYYTGYKPTLDEYLNNAWISISAPVILVHAYFLGSIPIKQDDFKYLEEYHDLIRWSSLLLRLSDDLGTSTDELKRGDNLKSIQCYMHDTGASEEDAREHIKHLIGETWKDINEYTFAEETPTFSEAFTKVAMNLGRMAQCMYHYGDGHASQGYITKDRVNLLLINHVPMN